MDQTHAYQRNQETLSNYSIDSSHGFLIKKTGKFFISACVCCFCFSQSSLLSFLQSFNFYLSTFPYRLFTHTIDKNSIFLIFNLLVVVIAKYSGLIRSFRSRPTCYLVNGETSFGINMEEGSQSELTALRQEEEAMALSSLTDNTSNAEEEAQGEFLMNQVVEQLQDTKKAAEEYIEQEHQPRAGEVVVSEKEDEVEEDEILAEEDVQGNGTLTSTSSTEDLNRKFEEFIRKMKEELRIEAQRQLIMV